jgi:hypothetical protein
MAKKRKRTPKSVLKIPDLEHSKSAVLNSLPSISSQRSYEHAIREFIDWYCSEPRLAFNKTVVTRYRIFLELAQYASSTINLRLAAVRRLAYEAADAGLLSPDLAAAIRRVQRSTACEWAIGLRRNRAELSSPPLIEAQFGTGWSLRCMHGCRRPLSHKALFSGPLTKLAGLLPLGSARRSSGA